MNAAIFIKSTTGLILASGLVAASSVFGFADQSPVALGAAAQVPFANNYLNPPTGMMTLAGHPFDLTAGKEVGLQDSKTTSFGASFKNPQKVYALVNSYDSYSWYNSQAAGALTLNFSDGTSQSLNLIVGNNVREWRTSGSGVVTTTTDPANTNVWTGSAQAGVGGGTAVIDMLTVSVAGTGKTLTGVTLTSSGLNTNAAPLGILLGAVTVDYQPLTPVPAPTPTPGCKEGSDREHRGAFNGENSHNCQIGDDSSTKPAKHAPKPKATPTPRKPEVTPIVNSKKAPQDETKHDETGEHSDGGHQRD